MKTLPMDGQSVRSSRNAYKSTFMYYTAKPGGIGAHQAIGLMIPDLKPRFVSSRGYAPHDHFKMSPTSPPPKNNPGKLNNNNKMLRFERISKLAVYFVCVGVLGYYLYQFGVMYSEYPTVVGVNVDLPKVSELTAVTVCIRDPNQIMRNKTCVFSPALCKIFDDGKEEDDTIENFMFNLTTKELFNLTREPSEVFEHCLLNNKNHSICQDTFRIHVEAMNCYVINENWFNASREIANLSSQSTFEILMNLHPRDCFKLPITVDVFIHDKYELADFRTYSFAVRGGKHVEISLLKTSVKLLAPPYKTKCKPYKTNHQEMTPEKMSTFDVRRYRKLEDYAMGRSLCTLSCVTNLWMEFKKCVPQIVPLTKFIKKCRVTSRKDMDDYIRTNNEYYETCENMECPIQCSIIFYDVQTSEDDMLSLMADSSAKRDKINHTEKLIHHNEKSRITINLRPTRNVIYNHQPKFTAVEAIGYVGGYVGIFLGLSIPVFYDYVVVAVTYMFRIKLFQIDFKK